MNDDEIRARFDGRGRVELVPHDRVTAAKRRRIEDIAHARGYRSLDVRNAGMGGIQFGYEGDDGPQARRPRLPTHQLADPPVALAGHLSAGT